MIRKYNKINSELNIYPFKTCPKCGLTFAIMGKNSKRNKTAVYSREIFTSSMPICNGEDHSSFMSEIDFLDDSCKDEFINEIDEFLLAEELNKVKYEENTCCNEKFEHNLFCSRFKNAREKHFPNVLTYLERCYIVNKIIPMLNIKQPLEIKESLIKLICNIYFIESLEMRDFTLSHPSFQEFVNLLWSTKWFLKEMEKYLTPEEVLRVKEKYPETQGLRRNLKWWIPEDKKNSCEIDEDDESFEDENFNDEDDLSSLNNEMSLFYNMECLS